jgi:hypothetical protein
MVMHASDHKGLAKGWLVFLAETVQRCTNEKREVRFFYHPRIEPSISTRDKILEFCKEKSSDRQMKGDYQKLTDSLERQTHGVMAKMEYAPKVCEGQ